MTPERAGEIAKECREGWTKSNEFLVLCIKKAILQACAEEREACAKIADKYADSYDYGDGPTIAAAIRGAE